MSMAAEAVEAGISIVMVPDSVMPVMCISWFIAEVMLNSRAEQQQ
jgi:hypothetical protein